MHRFREGIDPYLDSDVQITNCDVLRIHLTALECIKIYEL